MDQKLDSRLARVLRNWRRYILRKLISRAWSERGRVLQRIKELWSQDTETRGVQPELEADRD